MKKQRLAALATEHGGLAVGRDTAHLVDDYSQKAEVVSNIIGESAASLTEAIDSIALEVTEAFGAQRRQLEFC